MESFEARYLVNLYFRCKDVNDYPARGGVLKQTAFTIEVWSYINEIIHERNERMRKKAESSNK
jgi:hypothetical protein